MIDLLEEQREECFEVAAEAIGGFNDAINYAIECDDPKCFLTLWREGCWPELTREYPDFELPCFAIKQEQRS